MELEMKIISNILQERGARYGSFVTHARVSQELKAVINRELAENGKVLEYDQQEALEMICHKIARIVNGDPDYIDSWDDIAGYAMLPANRLREREEQP